MNIGEKSEICFKAYMLRQRDEGLKDTAFGGITELSDDANLTDLKWNPSLQKALDDNDGETLKEELGISKSNNKAKMDISINNVKYSIKEIGPTAKDPAIVNHTPRPGFEKACCRLDVPITELDNIIDKYWEMRKEKKLIMQDTKNSDNICPFLEHEEYMKPIIEYFLFEGTGTGTSIIPADAVLEIDYRRLPACIRIHDKQHCYDEIWPRLVFSVRSKGMPPRYPNCVDSESIGKWTKKMGGKKGKAKKDKGSLHIRYKPEKFPND